jgi:4-carboxymuconolactone decarboxylase
MAESEFSEKGRAIQNQLWGERVSAGTPAAPFATVAPEYAQLVREFCFGMFWSRPGLAVRDRSLITVAMLAALGRHDELRGHVAGALNVGISKDELVEALMHVGVYAGVPAAVSALNAAAPVLGG